jgi:L-lactate dehydrogenase complex protein LldE
MNAEDDKKITGAPQVGLFATCLVDALRPTIGFAAAALLEDAGCIVSVPERQVCCGQPAYNAGDRKAAAAIARQTIALFENFDYVVAPSGSCAAMLRLHFPGLLSDDPAWAERAAALGEKSWELTAFLTDVRGGGAVKSGFHSGFRGTVTYHDSCAGLRELGVREQPRKLLASIDGLTMKDHGTADVCCGFGGTFCIKYGEISTAMTDAKIDAILKTGADMVVAGDLGCLLAIAGRLSRRGDHIEARHVAELLAGMTDGPAIAGDR